VKRHADTLKASPTARTPCRLISPLDGLAAALNKGPASWAKLVVPAKP